MYVIVEIAGQQFKVQQDQRLFVHRLQAEEGAKVSFSRVLLSEVDGQVVVGAPVIEGASVEVKVLKHVKGDKVIVFKKKRRKGYKVKRGHRQHFTQIQVESILLSGGKKVAKTTAKKTTTDDLKLIEGIGPKAAEVFVKAGVDTFEKLSKKTVAEMKEILTSASSTLSHLDPETWAEQAKLAAQGKWEELKKWQEELHGGKEK